MAASYLDAVDAVVAEVVAPQARAVDQDGVFPRAAVEALGEAGLLGLTCATETGGGGQGMRAAADVVERLAAACGSTAMVMLMHYAAVAAIEAYGPKEVRQELAAGRHLSTLAFSEAGSRSHFWSPRGTATAVNGTVRLDARKSWVTSAGQADSYVWSSRPLGGDAPMTLWLVPASARGLAVAGDFDGLGLRGNGSRPMTADGLTVDPAAMLGEDGSGLDIALTVPLPWFLVLNAAFCVGLMEAATADASAHVTATRLEHLGQSLAQQPVTRLELARLRLRTDGARAFLADTLDALESGREDALLRVLEVKAAAGEAVIAVTDGAMKVCGGAAFRKELGLERRFRDARAARVMAPTTDALLDFVGRVTTGLPLFDEANS
ncbi:MAG: acyl-CoA dehydrogenase family protein [Egibacteraceae bacterium]